MAKYQSDIDGAFDAIAAAGAPASISRRTLGTYDPVTQAETGATTITQTLRMVLLPAGRSAERVIGSMVGRNIATVYIAAKSATFTPEAADLIRWKGADWAIIHVTEYDPAGDGAIMWQAYAERGGQ